MHYIKEELLLYNYIVSSLSNNCCVLQIPGGSISDSCVLSGVMVNKDVTHPKMKRVIKNPRILLLDCNLEYKKGESQVR
jgi:chaperonin GroEL (HSP60 family)